ncbi:hypothetical protein AAF712_008901 [Marasmius tenuissimus]|uniref:Uncharacterized protein n=1 Tax=Marasmius tenuissimus TaxID=585030 RepID=A0ABR2ZTK5_9AGAR
MEVARLLAPQCQRELYRYSRSGRSRRDIRCIAVPWPGEFCVLHERKAENSVYVKGWGIMVVPNRPTRPGVHLAAPHPQYDLLTPQQAAAVFEGVGAKSLLISGRIRTALLNATTCITGSGTVYYATDPAHNDKEPFVISQQRDMEMATSTRWMSVGLLRIHPDAWQRCQYLLDRRCLSFNWTGSVYVTSTSHRVDIVSINLTLYPGRSASSLAWYTDSVDRPIKRIQKNIQQANPSWNVSLPSDSNCGLTATLNVFGRFINGVEESLVCEQGATAQLAAGAFVHIEQAKGSRQPDAYGSWIRALNASFPVERYMTVSY